MKRSKLLWTIFVLIILSSCITQKKCQEKFPPKTEVIVRDSIVTVSDTIIIPSDVLFFESESPCPPQVEYKSVVKKNGLTSTVTISKGKITQELKADSIMKVLQRERLFRLTESKEVTEKIVYEKKWYNELFKWGFWIMLGIWVVIFIDRFILKG